MSSIRGGSRGRARGRGNGNIAGRGASSPGGRLPNAGATRGTPTLRAGFGQRGSGNATPTNRGIAHTNGFTKQIPHGPTTGLAQSRGGWQERYDKLEKDRKRERAQAISEGSIADPDKPRTLSEAITPVGRCMDMCAEFERVQRTVQNDVWPEEADPNRPFQPQNERVPEEARMVKKFRRAAAGIDEQLPADLRPPHVLKQTCDFLFDEIIANARDLGSVHHFVWDRTRAIRNDFTILQVSTPEDLAFAVDCFERIARFHILSLHQMAGEKPHHAYDWQQDREQLDRTLLSLMQYYDDSRGKIQLTNEPEFRAYLVVFQLQDPVPDLEDRVQNWPVEVIKHPRVRKALTLYAAACNTMDLQGPLKPGAPHVVAQQDWQRFWNLVGSTRTSYLMACMAEIYFNLIRRTALQSLLRTTNQRSTGDSTIEDVCNMLFFDSEEEVEVFCSRYNISFTGADGQRLVDLSALKNRHNLPEPSPAHPKQIKSAMVEEKRFWRTFPAIINGLSVKEAQDAGMIEEFPDMEDEAMEETMAPPQLDGINGMNAFPVNDSQSLFIPDETNSEHKQTSTWPTAQPSIFDSQKRVASAFGQPSTQQLPKPFTFGAASPPTFGNTTPAFGTSETNTKGADTQADKPKFNFLSAPADTESTTPKPSPPISAGTNGLFNFSKPASPTAEKPPALGGFSFSGAASTDKAMKPSAGPGSGGFNFATQQKSANDDDTKQEAPGPMFSQPAKTFDTPPSMFGTSNYKPPQVAAPSPSSSPTAFQAPSSPKGTSTQGGGLFNPSSGLPNSSPMFAPSSFGVPASKSSPSPPPSHAKPAESTSHQNTNADFSAPAAVKGPPPKSTSSTTTRKASTSDNFNKPAKPSPLAQSFTFGGNPDSQEEAPLNPSPAVQPPLTSSGNINATTGSNTSPSNPPTFQRTNKELFPGTQPASKQSKPANTTTKKFTPEPDFTSVISDLAKYITLEPFSGLLDQYIDFVAGKIITDVQETLFLELANAEADNFRVTVLLHRYGSLWRDICRRKRLARQGRERRRRNQRRLLESQSQASEATSLLESESILGGSVMGSARGSVVDEQSRRQEMVDKQNQQSVGGGRWSKMAKEQQARGGSKRPGSSLGPGSPAGAAVPGHKRFKSTSHVDGAGRVTKPSPTSNPSTAAFARSSFFGSLPGEAPLRNSTKTNYFKLKAMGQPAISDAANARARKRQRSEMSASPAESLPSAVLFTPSSAAGSPAAPITAIQRRSSSTSVKALKTREDDDALFARLRAARENLKESATFFQTEVGKADELRRSTSSYESPSLERARAEARWRASQANGQGAAGADVPAYRLRESKFVSRENYGKAIERSREFRASRSGNTSRPESRTEAHEIFESPPVPETQSRQAASTTAFAKPSPKPAFDVLAPASVPVDSLHLPLEETRPSRMQLHEPPRDVMESASFTPFAQSSQLFNGFPTGPDMPPYQPNLDIGDSFPDSHRTEPYKAKDHTIQPSQIQESLASSFGQQPLPNNGETSYQTQFAQTPEGQQDSYLYTQHDMDGAADSDDDIQITSISTPHANGQNGHSPHGQSHSEVLEDEAEELSDDGGFISGHDNANPFAALANGTETEEEDEETQWEEEEAPGDDFSHGGRYPAPPHYTGQYDDDFAEDEDSEGFEDGDGYDDTEVATEEDEEQDQFFDKPVQHGQRQPRVSPAANAAFSGGDTQGDAIELSD